MPEAWGKSLTVVVVHELMNTVTFQVVLPKMILIAAKCGLDQLKERGETDLYLKPVDKAACGFNFILTPSFVIEELPPECCKRSTS